MGARALSPEGSGPGYGRNFCQALAGLRAPVPSLHPVCLSGRDDRDDNSEGRDDKSRGAGCARPLFCKQYQCVGMWSGTIGTIGTIIAGFRACARACVLGCVGQVKQLFSRRLRLSSLSSLSSLKGVQGIEIKVKVKRGFGRFIVPEKGLIVPIVPDGVSGKQYTV